MMRNDLNFFSPYYGRKKEKQSNNTVIYIVSAVLGVLILASLAWNTIDYFILKSDVDDLNAKLTDAAFLTKLKESDEAEKKASSLKKYDDGLTSLTEAIESRTAVSAKGLNALSSTLPSEVSFDEISIEKDKIKIKAQSTKRSALGELEYNLKQLEMMQDVHLNDITLEKDNIYTCEIECSLKDVK